MKKFFKNNKGFTLVEMIIVIAVMAVLTVVVAPQYIKYVDKSRLGTDENAIGELKHIVEMSYVEHIVNDTTPDTIVAIDIVNGAFTYDADAADKTLDNIVAAVYPPSSYTFKSTDYKDKTVTFTINPTTGLATVS